MIDRQVELDTYTVLTIIQALVRLAPVCPHCLPADKLGCNHHIIIGAVMHVLPGHHHNTNMTLVSRGGPYEGMGQGGEEEVS